MWIKLTILVTTLVAVAVILATYLGEGGERPIAYVFDQRVSETDLAAPTSQSLAHYVEMRIQHNLIAKFEISQTIEAMEAYARSQQPELVDPSRWELRQDEIRSLYRAALRVINGEDPLVIFPDLDPNVGFDEATWLNFAAVNVTPEMLEYLELEIQKSPDELVRDTIGALRGIYLHQKIREGICLLPRVAARINARGRATGDESESLRQRDRGAWEYHCNVAYNEWLDHYLDDNVEVVGRAYRDYRGYLSMYHFVVDGAK
jgi:hypothetical protein